MLILFKRNFISTARAVIFTHAQFKRYNGKRRKHNTYAQITQYLNKKRLLTTKKRCGTMPLQQREARFANQNYHGKDDINGFAKIQLRKL